MLEKISHQGIDYWFKVHEIGPIQELLAAAIIRASTIIIPHAEQQVLKQFGDTQISSLPD